MRRTSIVLLFLARYSLAWEGNSDTSTLRSHDFNDATLGPFSNCNVKAPSYAKATTGTAYEGADKLTVYFDETDYDGTRDDKGSEICAFASGTSTNIAQMKQEGYQGFALYVPSSSFPTNKHTIIAQQFCPGGCSSWCGTVEIAENSLVANHRPACGDATTTTLVEDIARNKWHTVVIRFRASQSSHGAYEVWYDGASVYSAKNIDVGFGTWSGDSLSTGFYFKNGMYAYGE